MLLLVRPGDEHVAHIIAGCGEIRAPLAVHAFDDATQLVEHVFAGQVLHVPRPVGARVEIIILAGL